MTLSLTYDGALSRVQVTATGLTVIDAFGRTVSNGWGTADSGHTWSTTGGAASDYSVTGTRGRISLGSVNVDRYVITTGITPADVNVTALFISPPTATGNSIAYSLLARAADSSNFYALRISYDIGGTIDLSIDKRIGGFFTTLANVTNFVAYTPGSSFLVRLEVVGTTIRGKIWAGTEPTAWAIEATDPDRTSGGVGFRAILQSGNTNTLPVLAEFDNFDADPNTVTIERSTNQVQWSTVRGGAALVPAGPITLDDYEFAADITNFYRVVGQINSITPVLDSVWLKSIARPFLNRKVNVVDWSDVERSSRSGILPIVGRSFPVAVTDLHGSRRFTLEVKTETTQARDELDLLISTGEILLIHVPTTGDVTTDDIPAGYVALGDARRRKLYGTNQVNIFSVAFTEVAAPGPDVIPAIGTWQTVLNNYPTWSDVLTAHPTWEDVLQLAGSPADVVVP